MEGSPTHMAARPLADRIMLPSTPAPPPPQGAPSHNVPASLRTLHGTRTAALPPARTCHYCHGFQAEWLPQSGSPLCQLSAPLAEPKPFYQAAPSDAVLAWHEARYGRHEWPLPAVAAPHPDATERAAVFAAALLEGKVVPAMAGAEAGG